MSESITDATSAAKVYVVAHLLGAVATLALIAGGVFGLVGLHVANKAISRATQTEAKYNADKKVWQAQLSTDTTKRETPTVTQASQTKQIAQRTQDTAKVVAKVTSPTLDGKDAAQYASTYLGALPTVENDGKLSFTPKQVGGFVADKVNLDLFQKNSVDQASILAEEKQKNASLQDDLKKSEAQTVKSENVTAAYKAVSKSGKWKTVLHYAEVGVVVVGTGYVGFEAGKNLTK